MNSVFVPALIQNLFIPSYAIQGGLIPRRNTSSKCRRREIGNEKSTDREGIFPLQVSFDVFLHGCTSLNQESAIILLQPDVGVDDEEKTTTSGQAAAREEFARPPKKRP